MKKPHYYNLNSNFLLYIQEFCHHTLTIFIIFQLPNGNKNFNRGQSQQSQQNQQNQQNQPNPPNTSSNQNNPCSANVNGSSSTANVSSQNVKPSGIQNKPVQQNAPQQNAIGHHEQGGNQHNDHSDINRNRNRIDRGPYNDRGRKTEDFQIMQKLKSFQGPTHELPNIEYEEVKFSGRNRLYIGNLPNDITEVELKDWFQPFGEVGEVFVNTEKNFAFLKIDYHINAERAKRELDGQTKKNRQIRIRFAPNATTVRVKNLTPHISNELLHKAFEIFGPVSENFSFNFFFHPIHAR